MRRHPSIIRTGKKVTGLETKAAKLLGCLARVDDETRERINNGTNSGITLLVRMLQRTKEAAGVLNEISPDGQAVRCMPWSVGYHLREHLPAAMERDLDVGIHALVTVSTSSCGAISLA